MHKVWADNPWASKMKRRNWDCKANQCKTRLQYNLMSKSWFKNSASPLPYLPASSLYKQQRGITNNSPGPDVVTLFSASPSVADFYPVPRSTRVLLKKIKSSKSTTTPSCYKIWYTNERVNLPWPLASDKPLWPHPCSSTCSREGLQEKGGREAGVTGSVFCQSVCGLQQNHRLTGNI